MTVRVSTDLGGIGYGGIAYSKGAHIIRVAPKSGDVGVWPSQETCRVARTR
jgi:hypothetical protein